MTHIIVTDNRPNAMTKGEDLRYPVTIVECPPMKVIGILGYKRALDGLVLTTQVMHDKLDKTVFLVLPKMKQPTKKLDDAKGMDLVRLLVATQPKLTSIGRKAPDLFEVGIGGTPEEQFNYAQSVFGKDITVNDILKEGQQVDSLAITTGKGVQGPVKRFGVAIRSHKSEKTKRGPGSLGAWTGNRSWPVAHAGQMGFHQRMEYNKWILKIGSNPSEITPKGGFIHYGEIKNPYLLIKGSLQGPAKRMIKFLVSRRENHKIPKQAPEITYTSRSSKQ